MSKEILDACCGSRMFWFDKENKNAVYQDNRVLEEKLCDGRILKIQPDHLGDFTKMDFADETFSLVIFDPPHLLRAGENSWLAKKYGKLDKNTWESDLKKGFDECYRVLKKNGTLILKWSEDQIKTSYLIKLIGVRPTIGDKRSKTRWLIFFKGDQK